ncbi:hypothetical protein GCM10009621_18240 [Corynebacterium felinum]
MLMDITHITDPEDPRVDDFRDLKHSDNRPDLPGGKGLVIAEGPLVIGRLIESRFPYEPSLGSHTNWKNSSPTPTTVHAQLKSPSTPSTDPPSLNSQATTCTVAYLPPRIEQVTFPSLKLSTARTPSSFSKE